RAIKNFSRSKKPDDQSDEETVALFYGIPIYSKNLIFVADTSGSMTAPDESGTPRIRILRKELAGVVKGLADDVKFNIIVFNDDATQWQTKQVPVKQYKKAALAWIEKNVETIRPGQFKGHTNLYSGLTLALNITQTSKKEVKLVPTGQVSSKAGVDTIVIISDGRPDRGTYISMDEIRSVARTLNQTLQIKINTIAISIPENIAESDFLRKLAEENNGTYINKK
ncbi:MAG: VWA domain-containing protein, partial [Planctomycetes bacterium]|nr:VWA domain-containing protein [Planctomycetota bacterium]